MSFDLTNPPPPRKSNASAEVVLSWLEPDQRDAAVALLSNTQYPAAQVAEIFKDCDVDISVASVRGWRERHEVRCQ